MVAAGEIEPTNMATLASVLSSAIATLNWWQIPVYVSYQINEWIQDTRKSSSVKGQIQKGAYAKKWLKKWV